VIFLAPPDNKRGPILDRDIYYIDGTEDSYTKTQVRGPTEQKEVDDKITRVHTADDERASWVNLLSMLQREEKDSRDWDEKQRIKTPPRNPTRIIKRPNYRLVVGMQKKTRSWDFMPASITKVDTQVSEASETLANLILKAIRNFCYMSLDRNGSNDGHVLEGL
jgi:hypothetical protein